MLEQLKIDYTKIFQNVSGKSIPSLLDMLEQIIYLCDINTDKSFKSSVGEDKDINIREQCIILREIIKEKEPFSSLPTKEAILLTNIRISVQESNLSLCDAILEQLSTEIVNKELVMKKQERNNKNTSVISVVGIILTIFFGFLSIVK